MAGVLLAWQAGAQAGAVTYLLDQSNVDSALPDRTPYATVRIDDSTPGQLTFTVTLLPALTGLAGTNFGLQSLDLNVLGTVMPLADAGGSNAQWTLPSGWAALVAPPPNQADGFGKFEVEVAATGSNRASPLVFSISTAGTSLGLYSFAEASTGNAAQGSVYFAVHVAGFSASNGSCGGGYGTSGSGGCTTVTSGYFGGSSLAPVPLPAGLPLLLGGLALLGRQRRLRPPA